MRETGPAELDALCQAEGRCLRPGDDRRSCVGRSGPEVAGSGPLGTVDLGGSAVFSQIVQELFPVLGCDPRLVDSFPKGEGYGFYGWSRDERELRHNLRVEALRLARDLRSTSGLAPGGSG